MNVFLCWSGDASRSMAAFLNNWLADVIQELRPFMSDDGIRKGQRWASEVGQKLSQDAFGIICLTPKNLEAPWVLFEAGALSKNVQSARVTALLLGTSAAQVTGPLGQFQHTSTDRADVLKLMRDLNALLPLEKQLSAERLERSFDSHWPAFQAAVASALEELKGTHAAPAQRDTRAMTEEILELVRGLQRESQQRAVMRLADALGPSPRVNLPGAAQYTVGGRGLGDAIVYGLGQTPLPARMEEIRRQNAEFMVAAPKGEQGSDGSPAAKK